MGFKKSDKSLNYNSPIVSSLWQFVVLVELDQAFQNTGAHCMKCIGIPQQHCHISANICVQTLILLIQERMIKWDYHALLLI